MLEQGFETALRAQYLLAHALAIVLCHRQLLAQLHILGAQPPTHLNNLCDLVFQSFHFRLHMHTII